MNQIICQLNVFTIKTDFGDMASFDLRTTITMRNFIKFLNLLDRLDSFPVQCQTHCVLVKKKSSFEKELYKIAFEQKICYNYYCTNEFQMKENDKS